MGERAVLFGTSEGCAVRAVEMDELGLRWDAVHGGGG